MNPCPVLPVVAWHSHRLNRGARREGSGPSQPPPTALETLSGSRCPTSSARLLETFARPTTLRTKLAQLGSQAATQIRTNSNPQAAAGPECLPVLRRANLSNATLLETTLRNTNLADADLREADFTRAVLDGAILCGADLSNAKLEDADLAGVIADNTTKWPHGFTPPQPRT